MRTIVLLVFCAAAVSAAPQEATVDNRIIGGSVTTINNYPTIAALLYAPNGANFGQDCGGTILNQRSILSAAHCFNGGNRVQPSSWRIRLGSTFASSGGTLYSVSRINNHPNYSVWTKDSDIAILSTASTINYVNNAVQPAQIGSYVVGDNQVVWAAGWGTTESGSPSEQLRHVQVWTVNQAVCNQRYGGSITNNMLCSGWLDVGGRDQCSGDSGGPLYHNRVVVGVCSFGNGCGNARFPGVNARVSRFVSWIQSNS